MAIVYFMMFFCVMFAVPFTAMAWAMKRSHCPNCGAEVGPDPDILRVLNGH